MRLSTLIITGKSPKKLVKIETPSQPFRFYHMEENYRAPNAEAPVANFLKLLFNVDISRLMGVKPFHLEHCQLPGLRRDHQ